jgi:methionyl-tRNA formyltransferase
MYRIVFMGSPEFALPILRMLTEHYTVVGVVTQPDRPAGRGRMLTPPPIKSLADELHLPVIQPSRLSEPNAMQQLRVWAPSLIVVAAFGQILRMEVLNLPHYGCVNVHASLLPRWRGAAPIQAAILNGDDQTGVTIMKMDPGVDTGPILSQRPVPIDRDDTTGTLATKLSSIGAELLVVTLPHYLNGDLEPQPQDNSLATYAPMIKKEQGLLDFSQPARLLEQKIRALNPWPGAYDYWNNKVLKIHHAHVVEAPITQPGQKTVYQGWPAYTTGEGILVVDELQPAGKNKTNGKSFLQGTRNWGQEYHG